MGDPAFVRIFVYHINYPCLHGYWVAMAVGGSQPDHDRPPHPHQCLPPSFFPTPDQFPETSRRQQGGTPHLRTWGIPPIHLDRDPFRDRVRGLEYDDLPPTSEHMRGYPRPVPVFGLRRKLHRGDLRFLCKMGGYPHLHALRCPPTRSK
jgi:hypothetical protein